MKAYIQPYHPDMREEVINLQLRDADVAELYASTTLSCKDALIHSLDASSRTWVIMYDGKIIAVFGVTVHPDTTDVGIPWLMGSQELHNIKFRIIKYSSLILNEVMFFDDITCLTNFVSVYHTEAIKWLKWLGFTFMPNEVFLVSDDVPFKQFIKWKEV